eukprot:PhF_6_TR33008/c0_g1_i2/m.48640
MKLCRKSVRNTKFSGAPRSSLANNGLGPGPITNVHKDLNRDTGRGFTRATRQMDMAVIEGPGPGAYNTNQSTIRKRPMSVGRDHSQRNPYGTVIQYGADSPGPKYNGDVSVVRPLVSHPISLHKAERSTEGPQAEKSQPPHAYDLTYSHVEANPRSAVLYLTG